MEHKLRNELWARRQISILAESKLFEIFFERDTEKCKKRFFLAFWQITWDFDIETHIQGTTMWSLTSRAFRKCGSFWASEFLNGSYRCSKFTDCEILGPLQKIRRCKKIPRPQFCDLGRDIESACNQTCLTHVDSISRPKTQNYGRGIFLHRLLRSFFPLNLTWFWQPITMV